ncbi:MAG: methionyl-tRNA formyltransferase [Alphaproteobacteria bacterium]|nr:methionyl-tRNA formyltransferase [Alphaproteobacteria bacterium]
MKVIFMGTPDFSVPVLEALATHHDVICVYTQPPRPAGRGNKLVSSPVQQAAERLNIPVRTPVSLRKGNATQEFQDLQADVAIVCAYGLILPQGVLDAPKMGCINVHASLLPRWRGAAPIQRAIEAGDTQSGVTIMQMDAGLDTGDMLLKGVVPIDENTTAQVLHDALSKQGAELIIKVLENMPEPIKQPETGITYAEKIQKTEALIDWSLPAQQIKNKIMAFNPYPAAYFMLNGERIKVFNAQVEEIEINAAAGEVLDNTLLIACGNNTALRLTQLQREGKKRMSASDLLKGFELKKGSTI